MLFGPSSVECPHHDWLITIVQLDQLRLRTDVQASLVEDSTEAAHASDLLTLLLLALLAGLGHIIHNEDVGLRLRVSRESPIWIVEVRLGPLQEGLELLVIEVPDAPSQKNAIVNVFEFVLFHRSALDALDLRRVDEEVD